MAISIEKRKEILTALGYEYSEEGIKKLQSDYMARKSDVDGIWGPNTENCALTVYNVKMNTKNFTPKEFRCECNGKHCCGFPDHMKVNELRHIQTIRDHYGKPMTITCGLRCPTQNKKVGGIKKSKHLTGQAVDFYIAGVSDTLPNRKKSIPWIKTLPHHTYTYGHGIDSNGKYYNAPGMGNALHTDTDNNSDTPAPSPSPTPAPDKGLVVDGIGGPATIKAAQRVFGTPVDGEVSGQLERCKKYFPALKSVTFGGNGSALVMSIQRWAGARADGLWGEGTSKAVQEKLGVEADGIFGPDSMKAFQNFLNAQEGKEPIKAYAGQVLDVSEFQSAIDWNKVKAEGITGVMVRCGFRGAEKGGLQEDAMYLNHIKGAHAAGLNVGIYMFTEAINAAEAKEEARYAIQQLNKVGYHLSFPIAVDTEDVWYKKKGKKYAGRANGLSKAKRTEVIKAFCEEIKAMGYEPMIYASTSYLNNRLSMSQLPYKVWCAQYNSKCEYKGEYILWQYTSDGHVSGVKGDVDVNRHYIK